MDKPVTIKYINGTTEVLTPTEHRLNKIIWDTLGITNLLDTYSVTQYYTNGYFTDGTIPALLQEILKDLMQSDLTVKAKMREIGKFKSNAMKAINIIYNEIAHKSKEHWISLSLKDLLDIQFKAPLMGAIRRLEETRSPEDIQGIYSALDDVIYHDKSLAGNQVAIAYISQTINPRQLRQCLGTRGIVTDLDSSIFDEPVTGNYVLGLYTMYELAVDSRSAATALYYSTTSIQDSEVFAKKMQMAASVVENLTYRDCGTMDGITIKLTGPGENVYGEHYPGDLKFFTGMRYRRPNERKWYTFTGKEVELYGEEIVLRTALSCKHTDPHTVCTQCFGDLGLHKHEQMNLGMWAISKLTELLNQAILSSKHLISSATSNKVVLDKITVDYLQENDSYVKFKRERIKTHSYVTFSLNEFYGFKDITSENISTVNSMRVSKITAFMFSTINRSGEPKTDMLTVKQGDRNGVLTLPFLKHILQSDYTINDSTNEITIPLKDWRASAPFMMIPKTTFDFRAYGKEVRALISGGDKDVKVRLLTKEELLIQIFDLINRKLSVNMSILSLIPYILSAKDPKHHDYTLTRFTDEYEIVGLNAIIAGRSISSLYASGSIKGIIKYPVTETHGKEDHVMDVLFAPQEVIELERAGHFKGGG